MANKSETVLPPSGEKTGLKQYKRNCTLAYKEAFP